MLSLRSLPYGVIENDNILVLFYEREYYDYNYEKKRKARQKISITSSIIYKYEIPITTHFATCKTFTPDLSCFLFLLLALHYIDYASLLS